MANCSKIEKRDRINRMLDLIKDDGMTAEELSNILEVTDSCIFAYVKLLKKQRRVYICGYERTNGSPKKIYKAGSKQDVQKKCFVNPAKFKGDPVKSLGPRLWKPQPDIAAAWLFNPVG
jgi:predicted transcriptional regulator